MSDQEARELPTLGEVAKEAAYLLSDDWGDDEFDAFMAMPPEERVRHFFCSSDCDAFAIALHRMTGWPVRALGSPGHGFLHRFVEAPDGRFLDAGGWQTLDSMRKRYGIRKAILSDPGGEELAMGFLENEFDGYDESLAKAVAAIRQLPWEPFNELGFREVSGRPFEGVDHPFPEPGPNSLEGGGRPGGV
jgi:hypothetical protein